MRDKENSTEQNLESRKNSATVYITAFDWSKTKKADFVIYQNKLLGRCKKIMENPQATESKC